LDVFAKRVALWLAVPHGEDLDILCRHSAPNESSRFYFFGKSWIGAEHKSGKKPRKNSVRGSRTITRAVLWGPQNGSGHSHCLCFAIVAQKCDELSLYFDLVTKSEQTRTYRRSADHDDYDFASALRPRNEIHSYFPSRVCAAIYPVYLFYPRAPHENPRGRAGCIAPQLGGGSLELAPDLWAYRTRWRTR